MNSKSCLIIVFSSMILASFYIESRIAISCNYGTYNDGSACQECGLTSLNSSFGIVNGQQAAQNIIPSHAIIRVLTSTGYGICGATLISRRTLITAGHCVYGQKVSDIKAYLGAYDANNLGSYIIPSKLVLHPLYLDEFSTNNIALIQLPFAVTLSSSIGVACLPKTYSTKYPSTGSQIFASGWEFSREDGSSLMYITLGVLNDSSCLKPYNGFISFYQFCAGYRPGSKDTCQGDSGGPIFINENINGTKKQVVAGIISYGAGCARPGISGVYTRVSSYIDWIQSNII